MSEQQWKLVPVEPTEEMKNAYYESVSTQCRARWSRMLAVAPQPPALGGEPVQILGHAIKDYPYSLRYTLADLDKLTIPFTADQVVELVDRGHVARLQVEVEQIQSVQSGLLTKCKGIGLELDAQKARNAELEGLLRILAANPGELIGGWADSIEAALAEGKEHE